MANCQLNCNVIYLSEIPPEDNLKERLCTHFCKFGKLLHVEAKYNGDPKQAVISFASQAEALSALNSLEAILNNRFITMTSNLQSTVNEPATTKSKNEFESKCHICNTVYTSKVGLDAHIKRSHTIQNLTCKECNNTRFATSRLFEDHMRANHPETPLKVPSIKIKKNPCISMLQANSSQMNMVSIIEHRILRKSFKKCKKEHKKIVKSMRKEADNLEKSAKLKIETLEKELKEKSELLTSKQAEYERMKDKYETIKLDMTNVQQKLNNKRMQVDLLNETLHAMMTNTQRFRQ